MNLGPILKLWQGLDASSAKSDAGPTIEDRYRGVLLGVAVGNLLGIPVEGMSKKAVRELFPKGVRDINPKEKHRPWDDDLAQAVLLAEALLDSDILSPDDLAVRLLRWEQENGRGIGDLTRRVLQEIGQGTPATLAAQRVWEIDGREPASNGAVMRCAPVVLKWLRQPELMVEETLQSARVTHYDGRCQWSAVALNIALACALRGTTVDLPALATALDEAGAPAAVREAVRFVPGQYLDAFVLDERHKMGYTLKAMQAGLWALTQGRGFEETLIQVVNAGGDTDTNGAVAGAMLGGMYGESGIPVRWLDCIPKRDRLTELASRLLTASQRVAGSTGI